LPYELMTGDLSKVNYSSWRGGQLGFRKHHRELPVVDADPDVLHAGAPPR